MTDGTTRGGGPATGTGTGTTVLREYDPAADAPAVADLWRRALAPSWPLLPAGLARLQAGVLAVPAAGGTPVGFAAYDTAGSIQLIMVDPACRRRGLGTALLDAALSSVRLSGAETVALGSGGDAYIWPGVPENLPGAHAFFTARGWRWQDGPALDLVTDLAGFRPPREMPARAAADRLTLAAAGSKEKDDVLAFEAAAFPNWLRSFEEASYEEAPDGGPLRGERALTARDGGGRILGTLLFAGPDPDALLAPLFGPDSGTVGCVGVALDAQRRGVGSAMVARASELLRDAGTRMCHIGWTGREDFYRRVGYEPWQWYAMGRHRLDQHGRLAEPVPGRVHRDTLEGSGLLPSPPDLG